MSRDLHAVAALFRSEAEARAVVAAATADGWSVEVYCPYPVEGMPEALRHDDPWIMRWLVIGGVGGFAAAMLLQAYATGIDYPINVGGRDLVAWGAYVLPSFEVGVLAAIVCAMLAMLVRNRLPRLHHPVFAYFGWSHVSGGGFVVCLHPQGRFTAAAAHERLIRAGGLLVEEVPA